MSNEIPKQRERTVGQWYRVGALRAEVGPALIALMVKAPSMQLVMKRKIPDSLGVEYADVIKRTFDDPTDPDAVAAFNASMDAIFSYLGELE